MSIVYVSGGARSGKSEFAEGLALNLGAKILYIATATPFDDEMKQKIALHKSRRPETWETREGYKNIKDFLKKGYDGALLDCVTILITNLMMDLSMDWERAEENVIRQAEKDILSSWEEFLSYAESEPYPCIIVSNELGMGLVPEGRFSRVFRDIAGRANQMAAKLAKEAYFVVSGIPIKMK